MVAPAVLALVAFLPSQARAAVSVAGGGFAQDVPGKSGLAAIVSSGASIPAVPLEFQGSVFVPVSGGKGGGYALTAEIRGFTGGGYGGAYVGAGAGVGTLSREGSSGTVFTVFAGKSIAPMTSIELRVYKQTQESGATAGFVGVRFTL